jgi:hypothetical protein
MFLWYPFLEPHQTTCHSSIGVALRKATKEGLSTRVVTQGFKIANSMVAPDVKLMLIMILLIVGSMGTFVHSSSTMIPFVLMASKALAKVDEANVDTSSPIIESSSRWI